MDRAIGLYGFAGGEGVSNSSGLRSVVALEYDGDGAPRVTAKGRGEIAEQILALAHEHGVPIHEDRALTALLASIELGDEIPAELYLAVAEVLRFAYSLSGKPVPLPQTPSP